MKSFSILCATLSVIQVIFIGESTAENEGNKDYVYIAGQKMTGDSVGNVGPLLGSTRNNRNWEANNRIPDGMILGDNKKNLIKDIMYDGYGNDAVKHVNTGNDIPMRSWNNIDKEANIRIPNFAKMGNKMSKIANKKGYDVIGKYAVDAVNTAGNEIPRWIGNNMNRKANNIRTPNFGRMGKDISYGVNNIMNDVFGNYGVDANNAGAQIPRRLPSNMNRRISNSPRFNNNNQYQDEFAYGRPQADEYSSNMYRGQNKIQQQRPNSSPVYGLD